MHMFPCVCTVWIKIANAINIPIREECQLLITDYKLITLPSAVYRCIFKCKPTGAKIYYCYQSYSTS